MLIYFLTKNNIKNEFLYNNVAICP